jgi:hypothetical protein
MGREMNADGEGRGEAKLGQLDSSGNGIHSAADLFKRASTAGSSALPSHRNAPETPRSSNSRDSNGAACSSSSSRPRPLPPSSLMGLLKANPGASPHAHGPETTAGRGGPSRPRPLPPSSLTGLLKAAREQSAKDGPLLPRDENLGDGQAQPQGRNKNAGGGIEGSSIQSNCEDDDDGGGEDAAADGEIREYEVSDIVRAPSLDKLDETHGDGGGGGGGLGEETEVAPARSIMDRLSSEGSKEEIQGENDRGRDEREGKGAKGDEGQDEENGSGGGGDEGRGGSMTPRSTAVKGYIAFSAKETLDKQGPASEGSQSRFWTPRSGRCASVASSAISTPR